MSSTLLRRIVIGVAILCLTSFLVVQYYDNESEGIRHQGLLEEIHISLEQGSPADALQSLALAMDEFPDSAALNMYRGMALHARGRYGDALDAYGMALNLSFVGKDESGELEVLRGCAMMARFLETGRENDFTVAELALSGDLGGSQHESSAKVLLGLGMLRRNIDLEKALSAMREGLRGSSASLFLDQEKIRAMAAIAEAGQGR